MKFKKLVADSYKTFCHWAFILCHSGYEKKKTANDFDRTEKLEEKVS